MFTMLSGIRLNPCNRPYLGSIASNLNPHGLIRPGRIPGHHHHPPPSASNMPWLPSFNSHRSTDSYGRSGNHHAASSGSSSSSSSPGGAVGCNGVSGGKIHSLDIVLDKESKPVYEPGQEVSGKVVVTCAGGNIRFRSLAVSMRGVAKVHWTEGGQGVYSMTFNEEVEYFNKKRYVVSAMGNGDSHVLPEGRHSFNFRFRLPNSPDLATSFEGKFGSVRYFMRADLDQSWAFTHRSKKAFTLISPIDINTDEQLCPVTRENEKTVCCFPCKAGHVSMNVSTDRRGYCPGESVALDALFSNNSSYRVHPEATLHQTQTFMAGGKTRKKRTTFAVLTGQSIRSGKELTWDSLLLKIPAVSPTISNCGFIKVEYSIKVSLVIPGSCNLSVTLPVVIGTVPHRPRGQQQQAQRTQAQQQDAPELQVYLPPPPSSSRSDHRGRATSRSARGSTPAPPYAEIDLAAASCEQPPSYMECMDAEASVDLVEDDDFTETSSLYGDTRFVPMYRYVTDYRYQAPPAYSEVDPFPFPATTGSVAAAAARRSGNSATTTVSLQEIALIERGRGPRDSL